jgi:ABC-type Fe3+-siderophore transport system permease subunit
MIGFIGMVVPHAIRLIVGRIIVSSYLLQHWSAEHS